MATMNISLPEQMKSWFEQQFEGGRFANSSDHVRNLIRRDQERGLVISELRAAIDAGLNRGPLRHLIRQRSNRKCTKRVASRYQFRPRAEQYIAESWADSAERWGSVQANRYFNGMVKMFDLLSAQPKIAPLWTASCDIRNDAERDFSHPCFASASGCPGTVWRIRRAGGTVLRPW